MPRRSGAWDHLLVMETPGPTHAERLLHLPERLVRSSDDRVVAGVCGGLGAGLGVDPTVIRLALVVLTLANGAGLVAYLVALATLPNQPAATTGPTGDARPPSGERAVGVGLITLGALLLFWHLGLLLPAGLVWASALSAVGFALVWARTAEVDRTRGLLVRSLGGGLLLVVGLGILFAAGGVLSRIGQLGLAVLATGVGVAVLLGPWIMRLLRDLSTERRERIRSEERSEIAAHLHDSVLQTLALIQRADAPGRAKTLARRQERELRAWLFDERPPDGEGRPTDLAGALDEVVTEVEDRHDVEVDLVLVGTCALEPRVDALVAALREAAHNAARHAGVTEVSVYVEVQPERIEAYVRDRGDGFVFDAIEPGRLGVRESIVGRMARHGGKAEVHTAPGEGTEVMLEIGRTPDREPAP
jgi:signal transduction histidine kinase